MRKLLIYLILEFKQCVKVLAKSIVSLAVVLCVTVAGIAAVSYVMVQSGVFELVNVGVVIPDDQNEARLISQYISSMESVEAVCEFKYMDEQSAKKALHEEKVQAVIMLPESFYKDMDSVKRTGIYLYFPEESSLNTKIFRELLNDGIRVLQTAEAGVFASVDTGKAYKVPMKKYEIATLISYMYVEAAMHRNDMFLTSVSSPLGEMSLFQYYYAAALVIFLVMSGINFSFLYKKEGRAVSQKLLLEGVGPVSQTAVKILSMAGILWILGTCIYVLSCLILSYAGSSVLEFNPFVPGRLVLLCLGISAYFHLFYTLSGQGMQGSVLLLCVNILMMICSGLLIPSDYLPAAVRTVGKWLPLNFFDSFCIEILFGTVSPLQWAAIAVWIVAAGGAGALVISGKRGV